MYEAIATNGYKSYINNVILIIKVSGNVPTPEKSIVWNICSNS